MGCAGSSVAVKTDDSVPAASCKARAVTERDFHREYTLLEKLGQGANAVVYAAARTDCSSEQLAVKVVDMRDALSRHLDFDDKMVRLDPRRQGSIANEAAMMSAVSGLDNVCRMFEHFIHGSLAYFVLERCDRTLPEALASCATLNEKILRPFFRGMLSGIAAIHDRRIVHRDVKTDNFMCSGHNNTVKLCDFGHACALTPQGALESTAYAGAAGSAPFMAPEMLQDEDYGAKVDVWSFGVVVHVLVCGCFPYMPREMTSQSMKEAIVTGVPTPKIFLDANAHHRSSDGMSEVAKHFIVSMLSRSPKLRPTSAEALRDKFFTSRSLSKVCLRPTFESAKRRGSFDDTDAQKADIGAVDLRLKHLQDRRCQLVLTQVLSPASEASTELGSRLGESGQYCKRVITL